MQNTYIYMYMYAFCIFCCCVYKQTKENRRRMLHENHSSNVKTISFRKSSRWSETCIDRTASPTTVENMQRSYYVYRKTELYMLK